MEVNAIFKKEIMPILIHVNGVTQGVKENGLFDKIIDFNDPKKQIKLTWYKFRAYLKHLRNKFLKNELRINSKLHCYK